MKVNQTRLIMTGRLADTKRTVEIYDMTSVMDHPIAFLMLITNYNGEKEQEQCWLTKAQLQKMITGGDLE